MNFPLALCESLFTTFLVTEGFMTLVYRMIRVSVALMTGKACLCFGCIIFLRLDAMIIPLTIWSPSGFLSYYTEEKDNNKLARR